MDLDLDDPEDALFVLAVLDDEDEEVRGGRSGARPAPLPAQATRRGGCASGCGCVGCLVPALVIAAVTACGFGALPLAAVVALAGLTLILLDRPAR